MLSIDQSKKVKLEKYITILYYKHVKAFQKWFLVGYAWYPYLTFLLAAWVLPKVQYKNVWYYKLPDN